MSSLEEVQRRLRRLRRDGTPGQPLHHWGFTVYRTALIETINSEIRSSIVPSPSLWGGDPPDEEFVAAGEKLVAQFRLEIKDDKAALNDKIMREVREIAKAEKKAAAAATGNVGDDYYYDDDKAALRKHGFLYHKSLVFLYVDQQVLAQFRNGGGQQPTSATTASGTTSHNQNIPWIKVGEVDYEPERHHGNERYGPQHYFGAMAAELDVLAYLWSDLENHTLETIAPPWKSTGNSAGRESKEGAVAVWDSVMIDTNLKLRARLVDNVLEFL
ncbi:hypothetical protein QBC37DRAFT_452205 [Rhypophila decipiens]|uniref:Uncharacterized protein n=1 Tax=Rhypophila decipiens TaxID=261697 RepID=A0AAN6XXD6_9PEZI|nr:hypothetical protein QBC37DRAFT_452205 [Rhypophila decipiens]